MKRNVILYCKINRTHFTQETFKMSFYFKIIKNVNNIDVLHSHL